MRWPEFMARWSCPSRNTRVKIQTRKIFVDFPNYLIGDIYEELCERGKRNIEAMELYKKIKEFCEEINKKLEEIFGFIKFYPVKTHSSKYPIGLRYKVNWKKFNDFIREFAESDESLVKKHEYINRQSRFVAMQLGRKSQDKLTQDAVKKLVENDIENIKKELKKFSEKLTIVRGKLKKLSQTQKFRDGFSVWWYIPELKSSIKTITYMIIHGYISSVYRELRKIIENLSWCIIDDILFYNSGFHNLPDTYGFRTYIDASKEWFENYKDKIIRHLGILENKIDELCEIIYFWSKGEVKKKDIKNKIIRDIGYPILVSWFNALPTSKVKQIVKDREAIIHIYERDRIEFSLRENIARIIKKVFEKRKLTSDKQKLVDEIVAMTLPKQNKFIPSLPSNGFVIQFLDNLFRSSGLRLSKMYSEYSGFVHSYVSSWQILPFSSVLEFKILKKEITKFSNSMNILLDNYMNKLVDTYKIP